MSHVKSNKLSLTTVLLSIALTGLATLPAQAKQGDLQQQVKISAVSQKADIKNNQIIFFGPVNVSQGSININADELRAFTSENSVTKTLVATGTPATFSQELDDGQVGTASASEVRYDLATTTLTLTGNAKLDQAGSQVTGNLIQYNINKQELIAQSKGDGRVITIIQPENFQEQPDDTTENQQNKPQQQPTEQPAKPVTADVSNQNNEQGNQ
ncbi:lipopolysaccharide transport periplasmic protein LptA [Shewanella intestini]|uniref:Lipopolysaccharide export system protein LptA n=1 Tax=Shewanella intestini TaxID=2017544 RepID=A0ABS5I0S0_9GAMM|nr:MULTISPECIES: lipopolysaccharide transport periplasmic protein LptA [Shewanella]MBR9727624.1 lipopolysaccharide transport periplasmic protein LptA [Shewanella intestini]MRG35226.1 lipopolysaccharide transport periplasmic protein LptA [Shewanella sp. XMDDZSB0408]